MANAVHGTSMHMVTWPDEFLRNFYMLMGNLSMVLPLKMGFEWLQRPRRGFGEVLGNPIDALADDNSTNHTLCLLVRFSPLLNDLWVLRYAVPTQWMPEGNARHG